jgi:hypothetical protein
MAVPATQNLTITRGDTETLVITIKNSASVATDITGRTYRAQIRSTKDSGTIAAAFTCVVTTPLAGVVTCTLTPNQTSVLPTGTQFWDFEETITSSGVVTTIVAGTVNVLADVSR